MFVFEFKYSFCSIGQGKCSPILCGPTISLEMKKKLSISSWLTTESQVCQNVGLPNTLLPNLVKSSDCDNNKNNSYPSIQPPLKTFQGLPPFFHKNKSDSEKNVLCWSSCEIFCLNLISKFSLGFGLWYLCIKITSYFMSVRIK